MLRQRLLKPSSVRVSRPVTRFHSSKPASESVGTSSIAPKPDEKRGFSGGGLTVFALLLTGAVGGNAYYVKENPQFNPDVLKDVDAWKSFRKLILGDQITMKDGKRFAYSTDIVKSTSAQIQAAGGHVETFQRKELEQLEQKIKQKVPGVITGQKKKNTPTSLLDGNEIAEGEALAAENTAKKNSSKTQQKEDTEVKHSSPTPQANGAKKEATKEQTKQKTVQVVNKEQEKPVKKEVVVAKVDNKQVEAKKPVEKISKEQNATNIQSAIAAVDAKHTEVEKEVESTIQNQKKDIEKLNHELMLLDEKSKEIAAASKNNIIKKARSESSTLQDEIEQSLLLNIKELDAESLRIRIAQLSTEMKNRSKWETVRLLEALKHMEEEVYLKNIEVLHQQEELHKEYVGRELRLQEEVLSRKARDELEKIRTEYENQISIIVNQQRAIVQKEYDVKLSKIQQDLEKEYSVKLTEQQINLNETLQAERSERFEELENVRLQLSAFQKVLNESFHYESFSHQVHKVSVAALALSDRMEASQPLQNEIFKLKQAGHGDHLIEAAIKALPEASVNQGTPTVAQLQDRFHKVYSASRQAALVPEHSGLLGQILGSITSAILIPPSAPIAGDDIEAVLSRAKFALKNGDLEEAVLEMEKLNGLPHDIAKDWIDSAKMRLSVEQTLKVMKAHISLLAASCT